MIIVSFKILPTMDRSEGMSVIGELHLNNKLLSSDSVSHLDMSAGNLGFDIPLSDEFSYNKLYSIEDGTYSVYIRAIGQDGQIVARCKKNLPRNQIGRHFLKRGKVYPKVRYVEARDDLSKNKAKSQKMNQYASPDRDYLVFQKSILERVFPYTEPKSSELVEKICTEISKNEYKLLTFSIRSLKDLGKVHIEVDSLRGQGGALDSDSLTVGAVGELTEIIETRERENIAYYRWAPKIIESEEVSIPQNRTQWYWITLKVTSTAAPGDYHGIITVKPDLSHQTEIPIYVRVLPFELTDTDIQYGMMMDYAFYELDNGLWIEEQKTQIRKSAFKIYQDIREHGMTLIYPHSHFYLTFDQSGEPVLQSLRASLEIYKKLAFPGPFCWYLGHLVQTAKPFHPGSILNYDPQVAKRRLTDLLTRFGKMARQLEIPKEKLLVQLVDEADDRERVTAGRELNSIAHELGFKTLVTRPWQDADTICTGIPDDDTEATKFRSMGKQWWIYPNDALTSKNMSYVRYVFGFGAWRWGVNGVVPWTFQMSQGCNGNPFTVLDGDEVMVAYPGVNGPITTPTWELIREGINDYKYIYMLKRLIRAAKTKGITKANLIEQQLEQLKRTLGQAPRAQENQVGNWSPEAFAMKRKLILNWALDLYQEIQKTDSFQFAFTRQKWRHGEQACGKRADAAI